MWVARDKTSALWLSNYCPNRGNKDMWLYGEGKDAPYPLNEDLFPDLKWEDEPIEVELNQINKSTKKEEKTCINCKFKNDYPKCFTSNNVACNDWMKIKRIHKIECVTDLNKLNNKICG